MTTSRDTILHNIRHTLTTHHGQPTEITRTYSTTHTEHTPQQAAELLAHNLTDYRAHVHHTTQTDLPHLIAQLLTHHGSRQVLIPDDLPKTWTSATDIPLIPDNPHATPHDLDHIDSVITGCALAIAETGTIILDTGPTQGHRRITLIPDHHICIIHTPQIVSSVPQALPHLNPTRPQTWISGPSATSDIELDRVEGVHGPRTLDAIITTP